MAPTTSARNASPAPRAAKKNMGSRENDNQNLLQNEHEQPSEKLPVTLKGNLSQNLTQNEIVHEPRKQGKLATWKNRSASIVHATGRCLASACRSGRALVCGILQRGNKSCAEAVSGISQRKRVSVAALMMILIACVAFLIVYSPAFACEFFASMQKVTSQAWSLTSQGLAGLVRQDSEASADL